MNYRIWLEQVRHLDWREPMRWPLSFRRAVLAGAFVLTALLLMPVWLFPAWQAWRELRHQEQALRAELPRLQARLAVRLAQTGARERLRRAHAESLHALGGEQESLLLDDIARLRRMSQVREEAFEPLSETQLDCCRRTSHRWVLVGSYHNLAHLLSDLAQLPQLLSTDDLHWQRADVQNAATPTMLRLSLVLHRYQPVEASP